MDRKSWNWLSRNQNATHILEKNPDEIYWDWLSENPAAIHLISKALEQNPVKIDWYALSTNPAAIHLFEQNLDKIYWLDAFGWSNAKHKCLKTAKLGSIVSW